MILDKATAEHFSRIAHRLGDPAVLRRRELELLASLIHDGEDVFELTHGVMNARTWVLALTDNRLLLLSGSAFRTERRIYINLHDLDSIFPKTGWFSGSLEIVTNTERHVIKKVPRAVVEPFALSTSKFSILCGTAQPQDASQSRLHHSLAQAITDLI